MAKTEDRISSTLRLPQSQYQKLRWLSNRLGTPISKLLLEAVDQLLADKLTKAEVDAESSLKTIRAWRAADPDYAKAIHRHARAEAELEDDPAQGRLVPDTADRPAKPRRVTREELFGDADA